MIIIFSVVSLPKFEGISANYSLLVLLTICAGPSDSDSTFELDFWLPFGFAFGLDFWLSFDVESFCFDLLINFDAKSCTQAGLDDNLAFIHSITFII